MRDSSSAANWPVSAIFLRTSRILDDIMASDLRDPESGLSSVVSRFTVVVLLAPLGAQWGEHGTGRHGERDAVDDGLAVERRSADDLDCGLAQRYARSRYPGGMAARGTGVPQRPTTRAHRRAWPLWGLRRWARGHRPSTVWADWSGVGEGTIMIVVHLGCIGVDGADVRRGRDCGALADRACAVRLRKCVPPVV